MKKILFISLILFILTSCELYYKQNPYKINLITIGLDYSHTDSNLDDLNKTLNDAQNVEEAFKFLSEKNNIEYTSKKYIQNDVASSIYPSKTNIVNALIDINNNSNKNTINIIYYSGHGSIDGSWILAGKTNNIESEPYDINLALDIDDIYNLLKDTKANTVIISDSCYSGNFYKSSEYTIHEKDFTLKKSFEKLFSEKSENENIYFISATEEDNSSWEPNNEDTSGHGYFTNALLTGLGWDNTLQKITKEIPPAINNNILSLDSLLKYIKENQDIDLFNNNNPSQYPQISGWRYDLTLFTY